MPRHDPLPPRALERSSALKYPKHPNTVNNTAAFWSIIPDSTRASSYQTRDMFTHMFFLSGFRPVFRHLHRAP
jgi:hypothetical protein